MDIVIFGLSLTSSWGNGHATTYRALCRALHERGHRILFLERDTPWYAGHRDLPDPPYACTRLYRRTAELRERFRADVRAADLVIVGSYVPDGIAVGDFALRTARGVTAFYDIDTPITVSTLDRNGTAEYLSREQVQRYDLYLSFTGGPTLRHIEARFGARRARALHCSVDPDQYRPEHGPIQWDLGYMGTYSRDRQPVLERLMLSAARRWAEGRFVVAGPQYPERSRWPRNVQRVAHLPPDRHRAFYNAQRFTLNITRRDMVRAGYSPSVRLFEAAACATPIITDAWDGLDTFFRPGEEILVSRSGRETLRILSELDDERRTALGRRARERILGAHTAAHRAHELERHVAEVTGHVASIGTARTGAA